MTLLDGLYYGRKNVYLINIILSIVAF
jgi:hypothetical protein